MIGKKAQPLLTYGIIPYPEQNHPKSCWIETVQPGDQPQKVSTQHDMSHSPLADGLNALILAKLCWIILRSICDKSCCFMIGIGEILMTTAERSPWEKDPWSEPSYSNCTWALTCTSMCCITNLLNPDFSIDRIQLLLLLLAIQLALSFDPQVGAEAQQERTYCW